MDIRYLGNSNVNFLGISNFLLDSEDASGGGVFAARPRAKAWLIDGQHIGNFLRFPPFSFWKRKCYLLTINLGREIWKLGVAAFLLRAGQPLAKRLIR